MLRAQFSGHFNKNKSDHDICVGIYEISGKANYFQDKFEGQFLLQISDNIEVVEMTKNGCFKLRESPLFDVKQHQNNNMIMI